MNNSNKNWKVCKISDLGEVIGGATPSTSNETYYGGDIPWITPKDLSIQNSRFISKGERNITQEGLNSCSAKLLPKGSILFSSRAPIGYITIAENPVATNQGFKSIIPNEDVDNIFIYYLLTYNKRNIESKGSGTTFKEVSGAVMKNIEVNIPKNKDEQKRIADVLSALDDKIEINNKINENLEAQAQAIFKQWFVDFEFPDEEGKPYKSNGGKFIDSELGKIPEGWKVGTLGDVIENTNTGLDAIRRAPIVEKETGLKCLRIQDLSQNKILDNWGNTKVEENDYKKFQLKRDDIIMARTCSPGKFILIREDLPSVFNNGLLRIKVNKMEMHPIILSLIFKTNDFIGFIDGISGGTSVQLNMKMGDMLMYKLIIPPYETQNKAIELLSAIDEIILKNQKEVITLVKTRDSLLPKLMNGEVRA